jgi:hypothetical protein
LSRRRLRPIDREQYRVRRILDIRRNDSA